MRGRAGRNAASLVASVSLLAACSSSPTPPPTPQILWTPVPAPSGQQAQGNGSIAGTVRGPDGSPAPEVAVGAWSANAEWSAYSGSDGTFSLSLQPGTYTLQFQDPQGRFGGPVWYAAAGLTTDAGAAKRIQIGQGASVPVDVTMPIGRVVSGVVSIAGAGTAADFKVHVCPAVGGSNVCATGVTARDGSYRVVGNPPDRFEIYFETADAGGPAAANGAASWFYAGSSPANPNHGLDVDLSSGDATHIDAQLPADALAHVGHRISGTVFDRSGAPGAGAGVAITLAGGVRVWTQTADDGSYTLGGLAAGSYVLEFSALTDLTRYATLYYAPTGLVFDKAGATPVIVSDNDVTGIDGRELAYPKGGIWELLPTRVGGLSLTVTWSPKGWANGVQMPPWKGSLAEAFGVPYSAVGEAATAQDHPQYPGSQTLDIDATQYPGLDAQAMLTSYTTWEHTTRCPACGITRETLGGKTVLAIGGGPIPSLWVYSHDGVLFEVVTHDQDLAAQAITELP